MRKTIVFPALILAISLGAAQGAVVYTFNEYDNPLPALADSNTIDVLVNVTGEAQWDWLGSQVRVHLTSGEIFVDPLLASGYTITWPPFTVPPVAPPARYLPYPAWHDTAHPTLKYTTHVGKPPMDSDYATAPSVADYSVNETTVFEMDVFDTSQDPAHAVEFRLLRVTVSDGARGTIEVLTNYDTTPGVAGGDVMGVWETYEIGEGGGEETPPVADAGGPYGEEDWTGIGGYNNPLREILLDASGTVETDGDPILSYTWTITNTYAPGPDPNVTIDAGTDPLCKLTIADLLPTGDLPPNHHIAASYLFDVVLTATDNDGSDSDQTTLFVPEPGSLLLLGLGGLGALLRRRRR